MGIFAPSEKVAPNLKPFFGRFLSKFVENSKQKLLSTTNDRGNRS